MDPASDPAPWMAREPELTRAVAGRHVQALQRLEALIHLAEGDLDGPQAVVEAAEVGDWIIESDTGAKLIERTERMVRRPPARGT